MSEERFVVVGELGLTKNSYGAEIRRSEPLERSSAQELLSRTVSGQVPDFYQLPADAQVLQLAAGDQYLVIAGRRAQPDSLSRFSLALVIEPA